MKIGIRFIFLSLGNNIAAGDEVLEWLPSFGYDNNADKTGIDPVPRNRKTYVYIYYTFIILNHYFLLIYILTFSVMLP